MRSMQSRYLNHLEAAITSATSSLVADCFRAERACYLARQGQLDEANAVVTALRKKYLDAPNVAISSWLSLAEGLGSYFSNLGPGSRDKVLRAHALSAAAGLIKLKALSAAWLSQMDFTLLDAESLARNVKMALQLAAPDDHSSRSRANLVIAQALHVSGRLDLALPWYRRAHNHAIAQGDDATISALMHNMACMRLDNLRQAKLTGVGDLSESTLVLTGTESTVRFDELIGASSLQSLNPLLRARIHSLLGQFSDALSIYEIHISDNSKNDLSRMRSDLLSDVAWCCIQLNRRDSALESAHAAEANLLAETQIDDRAATHTRLGWIYLALGHEESANRHEFQAAQAWVAYRRLQFRMVELLIGLSENG